jgi:hypothetical protein
METRTCNSAIWILVLLAVLLLLFQGRIGLLAVVLPISLLLACVMRGPKITRLADAKPEKR